MKKSYSFRASVIAMALPYALSVAACILYLRIWRHCTEICIKETIVMNSISTAIVFAFSLLFQNTSIYDPYWFYTTCFTNIYLFSQVQITFRSIFIILPSILYSIKQYIYYFKFWPGLSYEDYRYLEFKNIIQNKILYWLFSLIGLHVLPSIMTLIGLFPIYYSFSGTWSSQLLAAIGFAIANSGWIIQGIADDELVPWRVERRSDCINVGLWKYSRHPNYLGELLYWSGLYIMSIGVHFKNVSMWYCPMIFIVLFNFYSIPSMEAHLLQSKKEQYRVYMETTSRLIPWFKTNKHKDN